MSAVCNKAPAKPSDSPSPRGGTGVQSSKSRAILIRTCITTSWHKTQKIKLKRRNWFTSKPALTVGSCTHRSITCCTHTACFWALTSHNSTCPSILPFSNQHLCLHDCIFLARQHLRLQIAVCTFTGRKIRTGVFFFSLSHSNFPSQPSPKHLPA